MVALLMLAWALRWPPALDGRLHPDEALYGTWGLLIGCGRDPWLAGVRVDKPPLLPYLMAGTQALFGKGELALRMPGLAAGLVAIPLTAALARSLYADRRVEAVAALGMALSPFNVLFSATAFTDPLMVTLGLGACLAASRGRAQRAGLLAGLAFATKQTGLTWLPLVLLFSVLNARPGTGAVWTRLLWIAGGWLLVAGVVFGWDSVRAIQGAERFWSVGIASYGGLRLIWPQELWPRLRRWAELAGYLFASPGIHAALLAGLPLLSWRALSRRRRTRRALVDLGLVSFLVVYLLVHWLWAFPTWDRYLLSLTAILAILLGRVVALLGDYVRTRFGHRAPVDGMALLIILSLLLLPAWNAAHSRYPIGGDHGIYDGLEEIAAFLWNLPEGTVVYQHWLGWQLSYYTFDGPAYLAYWPTPAWLARDVRAFGTDEPRYLLFPSWESSARVARTLSGANFALQPVLTTTRRDGSPSFTIYRIRPDASP